MGDCSFRNLSFPGDLDQHDWRREYGVSNRSAPARSFGKSTIARSSGDLQDAPHPDGATEFVDLHVERARRAGIRYAVMMVSSWSGLPFSKLERAFAGIMERSDEFGQHFDPRTVKMKFGLQGDSGNYTPMVVDLESGEMHWVDFYQTGKSAFNSTWTSSEETSIKIPDFMAYFATGARLRSTTWASCTRPPLPERLCARARAWVREAFLAAGFRRRDWVLRSNPHRQVRPNVGRGSELRW